MHVTRAAFFHKPTRHWLYFIAYNIVRNRDAINIIFILLYKTRREIDFGGNRSEVLTFD